jgi:hypothetical protein
LYQVISSKLAKSLTNQVRRFFGRVWNGGNGLVRVVPEAAVSRCSKEGSIVIADY